MSVVSGPPRAVYTAAVETLAGCVVRSLTGVDDAFGLTGQIEIESGAAAGRAGLAAVRVLGSDALVPFLVAGHPFSGSDAEVVELSFRVFPLPEQDLSGEYDADYVMLVRLLRDWATGEVLRWLGASDVAAPYPAGAGAGVGRERGWLLWTGMLAQLAPLAVPGLDSALHADVRCYRLDVARGVTRSMLRRDFLTAARLGRWLAACGDAPMDPPFSVSWCCGSWNSSLSSIPGCGWRWR
jgi:hypothetical protein